MRSELFYVFNGFCNDCCFAGCVIVKILQGLEECERRRTEGKIKIRTQAVDVVESEYLAWLDIHWRRNR